VKLAKNKHVETAEGKENHIQLQVIGHSSGQVDIERM